MLATILVVDDNAENRALAQATLEDEDYRVVLADSGEAALAAFAAAKPDCVLLDVRMPGLDGPATCERMRRLPGGAGVPVVFVTAQRDVDTFDRTVRAGGDDFISKPFRPNELVARVETALVLRRLSAERSELYAQIKQQRDDLQRLQLQKERLVAFLVHDLNNPVNAIGLHAQLILRSRDSTEGARHAAFMIRDQAASLGRMITMLLDIAKADEGQLAPARTMLVLAPLVARVLAELEVRAEAAGTRLASDVAAVPVYADPDLLLRVLQNLVDNAIGHAPVGTEVRVTATPAAGGIQLAVRDQGAGVPADQRERVFEPFVQGMAAANHRGLGLAFCKHVVTAHGGRIWIEDAQPGAAICFWLPAAVA